jgi:hypothetical protein
VEFRANRVSSATGEENYAEYGSARVELQELKKP